MRILYTASGEGHGHAIRSKPIIRFLRKKHKVKVMAGGKAYRYFKKHFPVSRIATFRIFYVNNKVSNVLTILWNILKAPLLLGSAAKIIYTMARLKPDVVVNDFETTSHYLALLAGIPVISVENHGVMRHAKVDVPKKHLLSYLKTRLITKLLSPKPAYSLVPTFFYPEKKNTRSDLLYPVLRERVLKKKTSNKGHVLVYQTSRTNKVLHDTLKKSNNKYIIYGFDKNHSDKNLIYKRFDENEFIDDLASCKALITNGGFTLISEALHLKKPILSNSIGGTYEQTVNAHYIHKLGYGLSAEKLTKAKINRFLSNLPKYRKSLEKYKKQNNNLFLNRLGELIEIVSKRQNT